MNRDITLTIPHGHLFGQLELPENPQGLVLAVRPHHTAEDTVLSTHLVDRRFAVLRAELLSAQEIHYADATQNIPLLARRLIDWLDRVRMDGDTEALPLALLASGDAVPAAVRAAAQRDVQVRVLVGHGGFVDRAGVEALRLLVAPLLFLFDADDTAAPLAFERATRYLTCPHNKQALQPGEDPSIRAAVWISTFLRVQGDTHATRSP